MAEILYVKWSVAQTKRTILNSGVKCQMVLGSIFTKNRSSCNIRTRDLRVSRSKLQLFRYVQIWRYISLTQDIADTGWFVVQMYWQLPGKADTKGTQTQHFEQNQPTPTSMVKVKSPINLHPWQKKKFCYTNKTLYYTLCVERSLIDEFIEIDLHASVKRRVQISTVSKMY